eukprot:CAMPEP_0172305826 /NCGR_PEP_ID=MMETSP1058-20130122/7043_1 /TAXON_ID=83371 /ORGANISM="Detonula confervacea, Strain CCMP 353" /LENGTH=553 /DNA_ID=CAMNT_0013017541 /DNA_START=92 /DNA_END=1753 /DNA_ORIENTATION=+
MSEGGAESGKQRLPYNQQGQSPIRQPQQQQQQQQQPAGSSAAHQMAGYILPPQQQQQQQQQYPPGSGGYAYPPQYTFDPSVGPQHLQQPPPHYPAAAVAAGGAATAGMAGQIPMGQQSQAYAASMQAQHQPQPMEHEPYGIQPRVGRLPADRPIMKLTVGLIETYKEINQVYYEEREARRAARAAQRTQTGPGPQNNGWDDENYDYIITPNELIHNGQYQLHKRIGKGSFGQVVKAVDTQTKQEVAIKIIKSKKPFLMQAKTEIGLLTHLNENDEGDQHNIVRIFSTFMYRNHQCIVFEMLSLNLYELLKNTHFAGVSLNLIRKFAKQILKGLAFLARPDIDIIHCDLKPENILLRHPKRSGVKVIDFGSSCKSSKRMYSYIQSRFYRSPEVMLGLPYSVAIDMWSLGCILVEMHTGEPLFSGTDQFDQMQKIVAILGMVPDDMLQRADEHHRLQFFEQIEGRWTVKPRASDAASSSTRPSTPIVPSENPIESLKDVVEKEANKKKRYSSSDAEHSARQYNLFIDLIYRMLSYKPSDRITPTQALDHPFITER